jgi:hypothetical protein
MNKQNKQTRKRNNQPTTIKPSQQHGGTTATIPKNKQKQYQLPAKTHNPFPAPPVQLMVLEEHTNTKENNKMNFNIIFLC